MLPRFLPARGPRDRNAIAPILSEQSIATPTKNQVRAGRFVDDIERAQVWAVFTLGALVVTRSVCRLWRLRHRPHLRGSESAWKENARHTVFVFIQRAPSEPKEKKTKSISVLYYTGLLTDGGDQEIGQERTQSNVRERWLLPPCVHPRQKWWVCFQ